MITYKKIRKTVARTRRKTLTFASHTYKKVAQAFFAAARMEKLSTIRNNLKISSAKKDTKEVLDKMAQLEAYKVRAPLIAGKYVADLLLNKDRHEELKDITNELLEVYRTSNFLIYLHTFALSKLGSPLDANTLLLRKMSEAQTNKPSWTTKARRNKISLIKNWRILDHEARNNMEWLTNEKGEIGNYKDLDFLPDFEKNSPLNFHVHMLYLEPLLQGKCMDEYLDAAQKMFNRASELSSKVRVINNITRIGIRRLPTYHAAYDLAKSLFEEISPEIHKLLKRYTENEIKSKIGLLRDMKVIRPIYREAQNLGYGELTPLSLKEKLQKFMQSIS